MTVVATEDGRTISLTVATQTVNGREFPITQGVVTKEGDRFPDDQVGEVVLEYAKNGERGFTYEADDEEQPAQAEPAPASASAPAPEPIPKAASEESDEPRRGGRTRKESASV